MRWHSITYPAAALVIAFLLASVLLSGCFDTLGNVEQPTSASELGYNVYLIGHREIGRSDPPTLVELHFETREARIDSITYKILPVPTDFFLVQVYLTRSDSAQAETDLFVVGYYSTTPNSSELLHWDSQDQSFQSVAIGTGWAICDITNDGQLIAMQNDSGSTIEVFPILSDVSDVSIGTRITSVMAEYCSGWQNDDQDLIYSNGEDLFRWNRSSTMAAQITDTPEIRETGGILSRYADRILVRSATESADSLLGNYGIIDLNGGYLPIMNNAPASDAGFSPWASWVCSSHEFLLAQYDGNSYTIWLYDTESMESPSSVVEGPMFFSLSPECEYILYPNNEGKYELLNLMNGKLALITDFYAPGPVAPVWGPTVESLN